MKILSELPRESAQYPSLTLVGDGLVIAIGPNCVGWKLAVGEQVRFSRHGTFTLVERGVERALVRVLVPRKGWNPGGAVEHLLELQPQCVFTVRKGEGCVWYPSEAEWSAIERVESYRQSQRALVYRRNQVHTRVQRAAHLGAP